MEKSSTKATKRKPAFLQAWNAPCSSPAPAPTCSAVWCAITVSLQGFFDALDQMIEGMNNSQTGKIQQGIADVTQMHNSLTLSQAQNGSDQTVVQSQLDVLEVTKLRIQSTLSEIEDLDYTEAVTRMNKEMMGLEAAMGSFAKISGLSLFDYIRG